MQMSPCTPGQSAATRSEEGESKRKEIEIKIYSATNAVLSYLELLHIFLSILVLRKVETRHSVPVGFSMHFQSPQHSQEASAAARETFNQRQGLNELSLNELSKDRA